MPETTYDAHGKQHHGKTHRNSGHGHHHHRPRIPFAAFGLRNAFRYEKRNVQKSRYGPRN
jgi:hypothetical protein